MENRIRIFGNIPNASTGPLTQPAVRIKRDTLTGHAFKEWQLHSFSEHSLTQWFSRPGSWTPECFQNSIHFHKNAWILFACFTFILSWDYSEMFQKLPDMSYGNRLNPVSLYWTRNVKKYKNINNVTLLTNPLSLKYSYFLRKYIISTCNFECFIIFI